MVFHSSSSEDQYCDTGFSYVAKMTLSSEKLSTYSLYQQKNEIMPNNNTNDNSDNNNNSNRMGINLERNIKRYIDNNNNSNNSNNNKNHDDKFWSSIIHQLGSASSPYILIDKLRTGGIPVKYRGTVWQILSHSDSLHLETLYQQLILEPTPYKQLIQRDITRTFPNSDMFSQESGQRSLERILHAYSLYDDEINYCQGLAFLVGPLLMNMPEHKAFSVFVRLMETHGMRTMFTQSMEGLHLRLYQFNCILQEFLPDLHQFFLQHGVHSQMYMSPWFLTFFAYILPMTLVLRIYDLAFIHGAIETMMRVALSLMMRSSSYIMSLTDFEDIMTYLSSKNINEPPPNQSYEEDHFIQDSLQLCGYVTRTKLEQLQEKYYNELNDLGNGLSNKNQPQENNGTCFEKTRFDTLSKSSKLTATNSITNNNNNNNSKKKTKKIKNWFSTISNKSKVSPPSTTITTSVTATTTTEAIIPTPHPTPHLTSSPSSRRVPIDNTLVLHQQIEDLIAALSLVQKENIALKNKLAELEHTEKTPNNEFFLLESKIKQLTKELKEVTDDRNLFRQEKDEAKNQVYLLCKQLNQAGDDGHRRLNDEKSLCCSISNTGKTAAYHQNEMIWSDKEKGEEAEVNKRLFLRRSNSILSDASFSSLLSSSSSFSLSSSCCSSTKNNVPHLMDHPTPPPMPLSPQCVYVDYPFCKSSSPIVTLPL